MNQDPHQELTIVEWLMNLTAIWCYLLSVRELKHNFSAGGNKTVRTMLAILDARLQN
jgi:hypothetical protein